MRKKKMKTVTDYKVIGIDLAKKKLHIAALDANNKVAMTTAIDHKDFIEKVCMLFAEKQTFAFEACSGSHYMGRLLEEMGHNVIALKTKDVKAYAKSRQKNDKNDAIAICKAALDPDLKRVELKSEMEQRVFYLHKSRSNAIQQRVQRTNSIISSLHEFGFTVKCKKAEFAKKCEEEVLEAYRIGHIEDMVLEEMLKDCAEVAHLLEREKQLDKLIIGLNKDSESAQLLLTIPGIGPINASVLSNKPMRAYDTAKDFAASLGLVPKQNTTGGNVKLGSISKQGDRYARTMLIQAGRSVLMRSYKVNPPKSDLFAFIERLKKKGKHFNEICVAVANKLARIAYACVTKGVPYQA
jgi:transposase